MRQMLRLSGIVDESIVDGPGIRMTVFVQGCLHHCRGCHNPQTHSFEAGYFMPVEEVAERFLANSLLKGITLSGGEPFCQAEALAALCRKIRPSGADVWVYSGYTFEQLTGADAPPFAGELLACCDVLVDGPFVLEERNLELFYRGSENQRVLSVPASLAAGKAVSLPLEE